MDRQLNYNDKTIEIEPQVCLKTCCTVKTCRPIPKLEYFGAGAGLIVILRIYIGPKF